MKTSTLNRSRSVLSSVLTLLASALLLGSLKLPLWQMRLEAPQYRDQEALRIAVHPKSFRGDLRELATLDQYIGVHIPATLPQFRWLPSVLATGAALGVLALVVRRTIRPRLLILLSCVLAGALVFAALQAMGQIRDIGHHRDQKTILAGIKDFTPPFLGSTKIAQFTVSSQFGLGAWLIGSALAVQLGAAWSGRARKWQPDREVAAKPAAVAELEPSTSH
jgi:copper chaperone NosL